MNTSYRTRPYNRGFLNFLVALLFVVVTVTAVDYFVCGFDIFFYCRGGNTAEERGPGGGSGNRDQSENRWWWQNNENRGGGESSNSSQQACTSTLSNACGLHGTGFIVDGVCNATPPPNSACPTPTIDEGFYADPSRVRAGNTTTLYWDVTDATVCSLTGGGLSLTGLGIVGSTPTEEIGETTVYTLTCSNGLDGPQASEGATVTIVPSYEEI